MPKLLQDKISIIYWAGRATGGALAREGVNAFLASRTQARVEVLAREISATEERSSRRKPLTFPFATALKEMGYQVALLYDYDSSIRNQRITAYLTYDKDPIENPMIDEADILIRLHGKGDQLFAQDRFIRAIPQA